MEISIAPGKLHTTSSILIRILVHPMLFSGFRQYTSHDLISILLPSTVRYSSSVVCTLNQLQNRVFSLDHS